MEFDDQLEARIMSLVDEAVPQKFKKRAITRETHIQKELGMDSIAILSMVFRFEELFKIDLSKVNLQVNMGELHTVNDLIKMSKVVLEQAGAFSNVSNG